MLDILQRHSVIDNYVLLTDVPLTSQSRAKLQSISKECGLAGNFAIVDGKEICQYLDIHKDVRRSYPQLLGLADLDIIVNADLYARSQAYLESWQPRLGTYVQTEAHAKALSLLKKKHFIVLDGPPEAGKSTIAAALALIHAAEGFEIIDVRASNDLFRTPEQRGPSDKTPKLFIADDAIGSLSLEPGRVEEWSRDLPGVVRRLNDKRLLIWTARRYILEEALAQSRLGDAIAEFPRSHEVLVEVGPLTEMQKAEMLYNHAKQRQLSQENKRLIKTAAPQLVNHPNFSPLRVSQLTSVVMKSKDITWEELFRFFSNPGERWIRAFRALSSSEQLLLTSTLDFSGPAPAEDLKTSYESRVSQSGGKHLGFEDCVVRLDHSFLSVTMSHSGERQIEVQHPSLSDLLLLELRGDADARKRYFSYANPYGLSKVIGGIAEKFESEEPPEHTVVPENDAEFDIFLQRLRRVSQRVLSLGDWEMLLSSAERVIPLLPTKDFDALRLLRIREGGEVSLQRMEPNQIDLEEFSRHWKGQTVRAVLEGFASRSTFEKTGIYGADSWTRLLSPFYRLTAYMVPPIYPLFTSELCRDLDDSQDSIRLANLLHRNEPLTLKQRVPQSSLEVWTHEIESQARALVEEGRNFEYGDNPDEFDDWYSRTKQFLRSACDFVKWGATREVGPLEELEIVKESAERPHERETDDFEEPTLPQPGRYWTITRLFEDL